MKLGVDKYCTRIYYNNCKGNNLRGGGDSISPAGRPKKENPRNVNLNIRITKSESEKIQNCADRLNMTRTDTIMKGINMVEKELDNK